MKDRLMSRFIDFEAEGEPALDVGAAEPTEPAAVEPAGWSPSQDEWNQTTEAVRQLGQYAPILGQLGDILSEPEPQGPPDLSTPESQQAWMEQRLEQMFEERFQPFQPVLGQIAAQEGEKAARGMLDSIASEGGTDFDRDGALVAAQVYVQNGHDPQDALKLAAQYQIQQENKIRTAAVDEYKRSLEAAATAPTDLAAPGAAVEATTVPTGRSRYDDAMQNWLSARHPTNPVG